MALWGPPLRWRIAAPHQHQWPLGRVGECRKEAMLLTKYASHVLTLRASCLDDITRFSCGSLLSGFLRHLLDFRKWYTYMKYTVSSYLKLHWSFFQYIQLLVWTAWVCMFNLQKRLCGLQGASISPWKHTRQTCAFVESNRHVLLSQFWPYEFFFFFCIERA